MKSPGLAEVWPLSPLQEGLLFHALYDDQVRNVYVMQRTYDLDGPLDGASLRAAGQALLARHANLRASFQRRRSGDPVQLIPGEVRLPWRETDVSDLGAQAQAAAEQQAAAEWDRGFDLAVPPLLRFLLIRLSPERHRLVVTSHHILADGWSWPVLMRELFAVHAAGGDTGVLPPVTPYRDYLAWLAAQDRDAARSAWATELSGLDGPTLLAPAAAGTEVASVPDRVSEVLAAELATALAERARAAGVTLNTLLQGAWGLLLGRLAGRADVVFGITVSGLLLELPGVESMLGLFMNTVPARVRLDPAQPIADMVARLQDRQSALLAFHYLGLAEIQRAAGPGAVFDALMVYENYPACRRAPGPRTGPAPGAAAATGAVAATGTRCA